MRKKPQTETEQRESRIIRFLEENRPILEDEEAGEAALQRLYIHASELRQELDPVFYEVKERLEAAKYALADAMDDPSLPAVRMDQIEKRHNRIEDEYKRVKVLLNSLWSLIDRAKARVDVATQERIKRAEEFEAINEIKVSLTEKEALQEFEARDVRTEAALLVDRIRAAFRR